MVHTKREREREKRGGLMDGWMDRQMDAQMNKQLDHAKEMIMTWPGHKYTSQIQVYKCTSACPGANSRSLSLPLLDEFLLVNIHYCHTAPITQLLLFISHILTPSKNPKYNY